jgi:hypothetical protein
MKRLKAAFARWKRKHWDNQFWSSEGQQFVMMGTSPPPLRALWEKHKALVFKAVPWLGGLIGGAIILKALGLA